MKVINSSYEIWMPEGLELNGKAVLKHIERAGRECYKSGDKITEDSYLTFSKNVIGQKQHLSIAEHYNVSIKFTISIGSSRELNRHRIGAISESSTRYCNFTKDRFGNELTFVKPQWYDKASWKKKKVWNFVMRIIERSYFIMVKTLKMQPQEARDILPLATRTDVVYTKNLRAWSEVLAQRTTKAVHKDVRAVTIPLLKELKERIPIIFDNIEVE